MSRMCGAFVNYMRVCVCVCGSLCVWVCVCRVAVFALVAVTLSWRRLAPSLRGRPACLPLPPPHPRAFFAASCKICICTIEGALHGLALRGRAEGAVAKDAQQRRLCRLHPARKHALPMRTVRPARGEAG